jgi:Putative transposase DNA-binding domain
MPNGVGTICCQLDVTAEQAAAIDDALNRYADACNAIADVVYKAARAGVPVHFVDPRDTSRTCPECGHCHQRNRVNRDEFECGGCGHRSAADRVGALNVRSRAPVSAPIVGVGDVGGRSPAETAYKPPALAGGI